MFADAEQRRAFTLIEVALALTILAAITSSVLVVMNRCLEAAIDSRAKMQAFEVARENMERLLASNSVTDMTEFGVLEKNPDIKWETEVKSFYEPVTSRMWVQAVCSATYTDSNNEIQKVELTHWLTNVTKQQVKQILEQEKREQEFLEELFADEEFDYTAVGLWMKAEYFASVGEYDAALDVLDEIATDFPDSPEAEYAPVKLDEWEPMATPLPDDDFEPTSPQDDDFESPGPQEPDSRPADSALPFGLSQQKWDSYSREQQEILKMFWKKTEQNQ